MYFYIGSFLIAILIINTNGSISGYVTPADETKFFEAIVRALVKLQPDDVITLYYGVQGHKLLNKSLVQVLEWDSCAHLKAQFKVDASDAEQCFHALSAWSMLKCKGQLHNDATIKVYTILIIFDINYFLTFNFN